VPASPDPSPPAAGGGRVRLWAALALVVVAAGAAFVVMRRDREPPPALYVVEKDGWRYEYHAVAGTEALFDLSKAGGEQRNVAREHADRIGTFRAELLRKTGAKDLEELREPHRALYEHLKQLGYM
jgi:hypothetical protein